MVVWIWLGFFGFPSLGLISNGGMGLIKFFWVFGGLIDNSGVGLISFLWVSMGLGFFGDGGGICCFRKWVWSAGWCCWWRIWVKDGEFGFIFTSCGSWIYEPCIVKVYLVMGLWVYFLDSWVWFTRGFNTECVRISCVEIDYECWPVGFVLIWWRT